jgi:SAM-dependent methyltransferase
MVSAHDCAEIARSASEASKIKILDVDLTRYQNPPAGTPYPLEYAFYLLGNVTDKVVLDLGCGSGEEVVLLRQRGAHVIGLDISPHLIAVAKERVRKYEVEADLRVASAYETQLPDNSIDVVFCMSLLHHLDLERVKAEICRILRPEGLLVFKEPIRFSWLMRQLRRLFPTKEEDVSEFEYPLSSRQVKRLTAGFQVLASRSFRSPFVPLLTSIINKETVQKRIRVFDCWALKYLPGLAHFATIRVMALNPQVRTQPVQK